MRGFYAEEIILYVFFAAVFGDCSKKELIRKPHGLDYEVALIAFSVPEIDLRTALYPLWYALRGTVNEGGDVAFLEREIAHYVGVKYAICFSSARYALVLLYRYFQCADKRVVVPAYTCIPAVDAVRWAGAKPYFVDVDIQSYNPVFNEDLNKVDGIAAITLSYLYGLIGDIEPFLRFARDRCIPVIEDAALCIGGSYNGKKVGSLGDAGVFSLQSSKIFTAWKGGVVTTNNDALYGYLCKEREALPFPGRWRLIFNLWLTCVRRALSHRAVYGLTLYPISRLVSIRWINRIVRFLVSQNPTEALTGESAENIQREEQVRFTNLQAAVARASSKKIDDIIERRRQYAQAISNGLQSIGGVIIPAERAAVKHAYGRYPIIIGDLSKRVLKEKFLRYGIEVALYYPYLCPETRHQRTGGRFPNALRAANATVLLPMHTCLSDEDVTRIIEAVRRIVEGGGKLRAGEGCQR